MAHFAEIEQKTDPTGLTNDLHWIVKRVVVVGNDIPANGGTLEDNDMHVDGETWCQNFFGGGTWKQCSYNSNFRKQHASIGKRYHETLDMFILDQPDASWTLDSSGDWQPPIADPGPITYTEDSETHFYTRYWDEDAYQADNTKGWKATKPTDTADPRTIYEWNGSNWVST